MSAMAEILLDHRFSSKGSCICGKARYLLDPERIAEHLADALTKAGYGKLADAWDEAAEALTEHWVATAYNRNSNGPADPPPNPYRSES